MNEKFEKGERTKEKNRDGAAQTYVPSLESWRRGGEISTCVFNIMLKGT